MRVTSIVYGFVLLACPVFAQNVGQNRRSEHRGQVPTEDPSQSLDRGRIGTQPAMPSHMLTWTGLLVDAACPDRSTANLKQPSDEQLAREPEKAPSPNGISVSPSTAKAERADAMAHRTPDLATRQTDPSCGITARTSSFAVLLSDGELVKLDEGGNTLAFAAFQSTPQGQAILNGFETSLKPHVAVKAMRRGDTLEVASIQLAPARH